MAKRNFGTFVLGVAIGTSLGVLFAPKKGTETRRELKDKMLDLVSSAKELSISDVSKMIEDKINEIRKDLNDLDKEKILKVAQEKCQDLVDLAIEKGTPVLKEAALEVRDKTVDVMKEMIAKLEDLDKEDTKKSKEKNKR